MTMNFNNRSIGNKSIKPIIVILSILGGLVTIAGICLVGALFILTPM